MKRSGYVGRQERKRSSRPAAGPTRAVCGRNGSLRCWPSMHSYAPGPADRRVNTEDYQVATPWEPSARRAPSRLIDDSGMRRLAVLAVYRETLFRVVWILRSRGSRSAVT